MSLIVQKFGGTSVGTLERIQRVATVIAETKKAGHDVVVVVSAMSGETDRLIQMANQLSANPDPREYDALVSTGECVSAALLTIALRELKVDACSLNGRQAKIFTTDSHRRAHINKIAAEGMRALLAEKKTPVITGFQGVNAMGDVTTLERGGSDTSAVAIAAALKADECQIYTDVAGVYTSDPRVVSDARLLEHITYTEMLALASLGAKVLHKQAVEFAKKNHIPVRVLSSFENGLGTLVSALEGEKPWVSGVAFDRRQVKLSIIGIPKNKLETVLVLIENGQFDIDMTVQNHAASNDTVDFSFTVHADDYEKAVLLASDIAKQVSARDVMIDDQIAKLSLVGLGMQSHAGIASKILHTLSAENIPIYLITSTEAKISTIIDGKYLETGARVLHRAFKLAIKI
ncbi:MAG: aspartate kinase [Gammaproteobacteria bacterium CG_4_10_14_0_8_um_filter_38_16]|nr:MAG: aspartate kinase [Gammaproteobacteria bacterium CG_4_10_14_0_8_um_filter_38_16]PJA04042.1 MAG: aspartate kinase [Gammaproteobacteria bacterium CG_4_10_14_0_2_um_filter_38_22]PJB10743.1 MAG: aspartate kinase [Gammaproteobacteria bacterium CG_4_9_14_3_um_filter_38_9]